jgi:hypothetical protein
MCVDGSKDVILRKSGRRKREKDSKKGTAGEWNGCKVKETF